MEKLKTPGEISAKIVRHINNKLLQIILEYVGFEPSFKTIFKLNSNFKNFVELIYKNQNDHLSEFKKLLFEDKNVNVKEALVLFNSFYKNQDQNWEFTCKLMSNFLFVKISNSKSNKIIIDLYGKFLETKEFLILCMAFKLNTTLREIHLNQNKISDEGAEYISEALKLNTNLTAISLCWNDISDEAYPFI
jgi:hypothetical protein